jgi:hypothetical protein
MGYVVSHRDTSGTTQVEDVSSLDAAVARVERLRNDDGAAEVRVFREVPIEIRTYYKVVIADEDGVASSAGTFESADRVPPPPQPGEELPGAFPLGSPVASAVLDPAEGDPSDHPRRSGRFGRGG